MRSKLSKALIAASVVCGVAGGSGAQAATSLFTLDVSSPPSAGNVGTATTPDIGAAPPIYGTWVGFQFTLSQSVVVKSLSAWVGNAAAAGNQPTFDHQIYLYDASDLTQSLLSVQVAKDGAATDTCTISGQFCTAAVSDKTLSKNKTYRLTALYYDASGDGIPGNDKFLYGLTSPAQFAMNSVATYTAPYSSDINSAQPLASAFGQYGLVGPNMNFEVVPDPPAAAPAPLPLLGTVFAYFKSRRLRSRSRVKTASI